VLVVVEAAGTIDTVTSTKRDMDPLVPVILITKDPVDAVVPALRVKVDVAVPLADGVTGLGRLKLTSAGAVPVQDPAKPTCELKPSKAVTIIVVVPIELGLRVTVDGDAPTAKSGAPEEMTVKASVVECDNGPLDPVIVIVYRPTPIPSGTKILSVDDAVPPGEGVMGFALNVPVRPAEPETERVTGEAKLLRELIDTVSPPDEPCASRSVEELTDIEKSPAYSMKAHDLARHVPFE
jgi:hypothetical protein